MQSSHGPLVSVDGVVLYREGRIPWAALAKKVVHPKAHVADCTNSSEILENCVWFVYRWSW